MGGGGGGIKAVLDWLEVEANFFKAINRGVIIFWVLQGVLSVLLQIRAFTKQINFKVLGGENEPPSSKNIVINFIALIFYTLIKDKCRSACFRV